MMDAPLHDDVPMLGFREPPRNYEAERALLGTLISRANAYAIAADVGLTADHFADPINGLIFTEIGRLVDSNKVPDAVALKPFFRADARMVDVGRQKYLAEIAASYPGVDNTASYAAQLIDLARKRDVMALGERLINDSCTPDLEADAVIATAERDLAAIAETRTAGLPQDPDSQIQRTLHGIEAASKGQIIGRSTGLAAIDRIIGALMPGNLYIIGARPSMGKTALGLHLADAGGNAYIWSGEMPAEQCHARRIAQLARIHSNRFYRPRDIHNSEFDRLYEASTRLDRSVWIDDTPALTIADVRRRVMRYAEHHELGLVVGDHLGKHAFLDPRGKPVDELGKITGGYKNLAKELNLPVVLLVQLNRGVEGRDDKRPTLSDLRDSGRIEEDADVVGFLYRESYYLEKSPPVQKQNESGQDFTARLIAHDTALERTRNLAEIGFAKNRHGPTDTAKLYWNGPLMLFGNLRQDEPGPTDQGGMEL